MSWIPDLGSVAIATLGICILLAVVGLYCKYIDLMAKYWLKKPNRDYTVEYFISSLAPMVLGLIYIVSILIGAAS